MDQFDLFARIPSPGSDVHPGRGGHLRPGVEPSPRPGAAAHPKPDGDGTCSILSELHLRGASTLLRVRLRPNRTVLWSLTNRGRTLNLHEAYALSPPDILDAFALLVREAGRGTDAARSAALRVREWTAVRQAMQTQQIRDAAAALALGAGTGPVGGRRGPACSGTEEDRALVRSFFLKMNGERFSNLLPLGVPLRLSRRMQRRLGHMRPGTAPCGARVVVEIALNQALLLPANRILFEDTLLHEMAHAADWLVHARAGHGPTWKEWATRVGCRPTACSTLPFHRAARRGKGRR